MEQKNIVVLLSAYNGEQYLQEQLESILGQKTSHHVEIVVRDDGSNDGTVEILKRYESQYPNKIHVYYENNIGYIQSFFELIRKVDGYDYYALSDQDDIWLEDKLESAVVQCEACGEKGPLLYASSSFLVNENLEIVGETQKNLRGLSWNNALIQNIFPGHAEVFDNALCQRLKREIDCSKIYVHDFWILYMAMLYGKVIFDNTSHTWYRQHGTNTVGFGKNRLEWIVGRLKRIGNSDNKKIAAQINYFYEEYQGEMDEKLRNSVADFLHSQKSLWKRIGYLSRTKLYRQKKFETILFKMLYLFGGYKLP